jgi:hypothetical protein
MLAETQLAVGRRVGGALGLGRGCQIPPAAPTPLPGIPLPENHPTHPWQPPPDLQRGHLGNRGSLPAVEPVGRTSQTLVNPRPEGPSLPEWVVGRPPTRHVAVATYFLENLATTVGREAQAQHQ